MSKVLGFLLPIGISVVSTPVIAQGGIEKSASSTQLTYATYADDSGWDVVMPGAFSRVIKIL